MSNIIQHVTRTLYGSYLQTTRMLQRPLNVMEYTTINEAIADSIIVPYQPSVGTVGLQETETFDDLNDSANIGIKYVVIGNGGHVATVNSTNSVSYMDINIHEATDACPFKLIPFVCRPLENDLSDTERPNYRLRKVLNIAGEFYVAYYAKVIDFSNSQVTMNLSQTVNGINTTHPFTPTINNLRCVPQNPGVENSGTSTYASANAVFSFTQTDVNYLIEAAVNLWGDSNQAIISEIAFCSGVDKPIVRTYPSNGIQTADTTIASRNLVEANAVQVCCFANTYYQANFGMLGFDVPFDIGAIEPLFSKQS